MDFASAGLTMGQMNAIVKKLGGKEAALRFLRGKLMVSASPTATAVANPELLSVDHSKTLEQMIADGHYDWVNSDINPERFPVKGEGVEELEWKEFHFDFDIESDDAKTRIETADTGNPWIPARIEHLLAYGTKFPDNQRQYPIVGLGSVGGVDGGRCVPCLSGSVSGRDLGLSRWDGRWGRGCRFLAVRKVSAPQT